MAQKIIKNPQPRFKRTKAWALSLTMIFGGGATMTGCTHLTEVNKDIFQSADIFQNRVETLDIGMSKQQVLGILSKSSSDASAYKNTEKAMLSIEDKREKRLAVYGDGRAPLTLSEKEEERVYMNRLDVFRIPFKDILSKETFAFSNIKDSERGYSMSVTLIFKDGKLLENPKIDGGFARKEEKESVFKSISKISPLKSIF